MLAAYDALAERFANSRLEGRPTSVVWFDTLMKRLLSGQRKTSFCGGGRDYLGVAADGAVSLCYRFYQNDEYSMGDVFQGVEHGGAVDRVLEPLENRPACSTCWARHFCGGGCHHENLITTGNLGDPNPVTCEILRHSMDRTLETWGRLTAEERMGTRRPTDNRNQQGSGMTQDETTIRMDDKPRVKPSCHVREVAAERVVYEPTVHEVAFLNVTAAWIFERCDGDRTVQDLLDALVARYAAPKETLSHDLLETLSMFRQKGLLCPA